MIPASLNTMLMDQPVISGGGSVPNPTLHFNFNNPVSSGGISTNTDVIGGRLATTLDANMTYVSDGSGGLAVNVSNVANADVDMVNALSTFTASGIGTILIRVKNIANDNNNILLSTSLTSANNRYFTIYPDRVQVRNNTSGTSYDIVFNMPVTYVTGDWNNFVFRASTINVACEAFINGVQRTATTSPTNIGSTNYWISAVQSNVLNAFRRYITTLQIFATANAQISDVKYWNTALTNAEIATLGQLP